MARAKHVRDSIDDILAGAVNRREVLLAAAGAGLVLPGLARTPGAAARQDEAGQPGGTATIVVGANPASWDLTKSTWVTWQAVAFLYDRLVSFDENEELQPALAESWEVSEDGLEYTLKLRSGVSFHDGTPFNAEAVKFNIQRHLDQPDSAFYSVFAPITSVEVVDDLTAKIILGEVRPNFAYEGLAQWGSIQLSPTAVAELGDRFAENPVGTGPFTFVSYEPGSVIKYARNENYWGDPPLLDAVEVRVIPEPSVQLIEIEAGTIDNAQIQPKDVETLEAAGLTIEQTIAPGAHFISLNLSKEPISELAVRQAIAHAIDRDTIIQTVLLGFGEKSRAGVTSDSFFYDESVPMIEFNPEEAGRILDEAGWVLGDDGIRQRDGAPLVVNILSTDFLTWGLFNQIIQEQLKAVGIDSTINSLEWNAYLDQWRENQGDWHVTYHSQGSIMARTEPIQASWVPNDYWSITQIDDATAAELEPVREELQALQDEFLVTLDDARRKEISSRAQTLFQENQLTVWLWHGATIQAVQPRLQGYRLTHAGRVIELDKAWIEE